LSDFVVILTTTVSGCCVALFSVQNFIEHSASFLLTTNISFHSGIRCFVPSAWQAKRTIDCSAQTNRRS